MALNIQNIHAQGGIRLPQHHSHYLSGCVAGTKKEWVCKKKSLGGGTKLTAIRDRCFRRFVLS
jgi:hypothetical protein